jgi:hypothetical protein
MKLTFEINAISVLMLLAVFEYLLHYLTWRLA